MTGVRIVTDSACDLTSTQASDLGVTVVPLTIRFGTEELTDREELSVEDFYARMAEADALPETAAPSPGAFEQAFRDAQSDGADAVVCINISAQLSATMQSAENAAGAVDDLDVRVLDSRSISSGLGGQVIRAAEAARSGATADEIVAMIESVRERTRVIAALDTLDNLKKGGRIGGAQAFLGSVLSIKPVIDVSTGAVEEAAKPRTRRKAMEWMRDRLFSEGPCEDVTIADGMAPDAQALEDLLVDRYPREELRHATIGAVIGAHGGPRVLGITYVVPA